MSSLLFDMTEEKQGLSGDGTTLLMVVVHGLRRIG